MGSRTALAVVVVPSQLGAVGAEEPAKDESISPPCSSGSGRIAQDLMAPAASGEFSCAAKGDGKICLSWNKEKVFEPSLKNLHSSFFVSCRSRVSHKVHGHRVVTECVCRRLKSEQLCGQVYMYLSTGVSCSMRCCACPW